MPRLGLVAPAFAALALLGACAADSVTSNPPVKVVEIVEASATVQTVDKQTREILLVDDASGDSFVLVAGDEVKNFDQIDSGDKVKVVYSLGRAARMALPGRAGTTSTVVAGTAEEGAKPAAAIGSVTTTVLEFVAYDPGTAQATVINAEWIERTVTVETSEGREFASRLKKGDKVEVTFTEALAVVVEEQ